MTPHYDDGVVSVYHADSLDLLRSLPDASVQLVATDPPYFRVKDEAWDNAWKDERAFLRWIGALCKEWRRVLAPSGSLYVFASPQMAHGVERVVRRHFRVLTNIRWRKPPFSTKAEMFDKDDLRAPFPASETLLFAEQRLGLTAMLRASRAAAGLTMDNVDVRLGNIRTANPNRGTELCRRWEEGSSAPTAEQWAAMRAFIRLPPYERVSRPFNATADAPYTDVWDFPTVSSYPGKHPCEKPLAMMEHIVRVSSRPGDTVLDSFSGSGATAEAARNLGRLAIVGDSDAHWCRKTAERLSQGTLFAGEAA